MRRCVYLGIGRRSRSVHVPSDGAIHHARMGKTFAQRLSAAIAQDRNRSPVGPAPVARRAHTMADGAPHSHVGNHPEMLGPPEARGGLVETAARGRAAEKSCSYLDSSRPNKGEVSNDGSTIRPVHPARPDRY